MIKGIVLELLMLFFMPLWVIAHDINNYIKWRKADE